MEGFHKQYLIACTRLNIVDATRATLTSAIFRILKSSLPPEVCSDSHIRI